MTRHRPILHDPRYRRRAAAGILLVASLGACSSTSTALPDPCSVRVVAITTRNPKVPAGDTLTIPATVVPQCLPAGTAAANARWTSTDTTVLRVDSLPRVVSADSLEGIAVGLRAGTAGVLVSVAGSADARDSIGVLVLSAP